MKKKTEQNTRLCKLTLKKRSLNFRYFGLFIIGDALFFNVCRFSSDCCFVYQNTHTHKPTFDSTHTQTSNKKRINCHFHCENRKKQRKPKHISQ